MTMVFKTATDTVSNLKERLSWRKWSVTRFWKDIVMSHLLVWVSLLDRQFQENHKKSW